MAHKLINISPKTQNRIEQNITLGKNICTSYGITQKDTILPKDLDITFKLWKEDQRPEKITSAEVIQGLGCLFGGLMRLEFGLQWKIVDDNLGTSLALIHSKSTWETYPLDFVAKRTDSQDDEFGFFEAMHQLMKNELYPAI